MNLKEFFYTTIDLVLPAVCPVCKDAHVNFRDLICERCLELLMQDIKPAIISTNHIIEILSCASYDRAVKECIKQFKYYKKPGMMRIFERIIPDVIDKIPVIKNGGAHIIVPVPLHKKRMRSRTFNQAEIIAKYLSELLSIPADSANLIRIKNTQAQTSLSRSSRKNNLKTAFRVRFPENLAGKRVILVDDVVTTGATLESCAVELLRRGAERIYGFTLARTI